MPTVIVLGGISKEQEIAWLEQALTDKTLAESPTGQILAEVLKCLLCGTANCTPTESPMPSPSPKPSTTPSTCIASESDKERKAGYTFDTHGQSVIIQGTATIDDHPAFTSNSPFKQVDVLADGKNHHVVIGYRGVPQKVNQYLMFKNLINAQIKGFVIKTYKDDLSEIKRKLDLKVYI